MEETPIGEASKGVIAREPVLFTAALRALGNGYYSSGEREFQTLRFLSDFEKNTFQGARCPQNNRGSRDNKLAPARMHPGGGACRNA